MGQIILKRPTLFARYSLVGNTHSSGLFSRWTIRGVSGAARIGDGLHVYLVYSLACYTFRETCAAKSRYIHAHH